MTTSARKPCPPWPPLREWLTPATLLLVAVNIIPLIGVLWWDWKVFPLMFLFWCENVVVGLFNLLRMLTLRITDPVAWLGKCFFIPFFCVHYGIFTLVHGIFVLSLFGGERRVVGLIPDYTMMVGIVHEYYLGMPLLALVLSHAFSFFYNFLYKGEFRTTRLDSLMSRPYGRVIVLHITILGGGFLTMTMGSPLWALIVLILLKTGIDGVAHIREHSKAQDAKANALGTTA